MASGAKKAFTRVLPSEHEEQRQREQQEDAARELAARRKRSRELAAFDWFLKQENGRIVWAWLFERCGYKPGLLRSSAGDIATISTECIAAQREVYRDLRKMIAAPELLAKAEFEAEFGVQDQTQQKGER